MMYTKQDESDSVGRRSRVRSRTVVVCSIRRRGSSKYYIQLCRKKSPWIVSGLSGFSDLYACLPHGSSAHRVGI